MTDKNERVALITPSGRKADARAALADVLVRHGWQRADAVEETAPEAPETEAPAEVEVAEEPAPAPRRRRKADAADEE